MPLELFVGGAKVKAAHENAAGTSRVLRRNRGVFPWLKQVETVFLSGEPWFKSKAKWQCRWSFTAMVWHNSR